MITATLIMILARTGILPPLWAERLNSIIRSAGKKTVSLFIGFLVLNSIFSQQQTLEYQILRKGDVVGNLVCTKNSYPGRMILKTESEVNTRFIIRFQAEAQEETIYENGILTKTSVFRKLNGKIKADKRIITSGNSYKGFDGSRSIAVNIYPIRYNLVCLYFIEPDAHQKVFSDNFQQYVEIKKLGTAHYRIDFPDGNYNEYFYSGGICSRIEINHSLYKATIELKS